MKVIVIVVVLFITIIGLVKNKVSTTYFEDSKDFDFQKDRVTNVPFIYPFDTKKELEDAEKNDPFGFPSTNYDYSLEEFKKVYPEYRRAINSGRGLFPFEDKLINVVKNVFHYDERTKKNTSLVLKGKYFPGTFNLDKEKIEKVECTIQNEITVRTQDLDLLKALLPGTRGVYEYLDHSESDCPIVFRHRYFMVKKRKGWEWVSKLFHRMKLEIIPLSLNEMFVDMDVLLKHLPTDEKVQKHVDKTKSLMFFGFNYNNDTKSSEKSDINLYKDNFNSIDCVNCYSYLDAGIILKLDTEWWKVKNFKLGVYGKFESNFELKYDFGYHFDKVWKQQIFSYKMPSIKVMIGSIPLYIAPAIEMNLEEHVQIDAHLEISTKFYSEGYAEYSINYDGENFFGDSKVELPTIDFTPPHVLASESHASLDTKITAYPSILLYVYACIPFEFVTSPAFYFSGKADTKKINWETSYSVDGDLSLNPLEVPKKIPKIGGKMFKLNGKLPWEKKTSFVEKTKLTCEYCSGEIEF